MHPCAAGHRLSLCVRVNDCDYLHVVSDRSKMQRSYASTCRSVIATIRSVWSQSGQPPLKCLA